ncbi:MAG: hypothetical protein ACFFCW_38100 [Candidatus Hodarchaeota archaeon]
MKAIKNITTMNNVIAPRIKLLVTMYPYTMTPNAKNIKTTSKALLTIWSLLMEVVSVAEAAANVKTNPITIVTTFSDRNPLKNKIKPSIPSNGPHRSLHFTTAESLNEFYSHLR